VNLGPSQAQVSLTGQALPPFPNLIYITSRERGRLALKRLRGLTADMADLATKIAALIAAVNGLS
jgi:hypothetical protein